MALYVTVLSADADLDTNINQGYNYFFVDCTNNNVNISMQNILGDGMNYTITRIDNTSNTLTLTPKTGNTCNNLSSIEVLPNVTIPCVTNNLNWVCPKITYSL
jgi:DNA-binding beta-propeller fold protein YncE